MKWVCGTALLVCVVAIGAYAVDKQPQPKAPGQKASAAIPRVDKGDIPPPAGASKDKQRAVSRESIDYLNKLRKNTPFGTRSFDLKALRAGMGSRRPPRNKDIKLIRVKVGTIPCEWVLAPGADPDLRLLYLHGGGFVSGSGGFYLTLAAHLSAAARCAVLLPDYRLAPEHRFPAGIEDCVRSHEWMVANGPAGPAPSRATFIAGDSAGGSLTLATLLALRDRKRALPAGGIALSPTTDLTLASESLKTVHDPILSAKTMPVFRDHYLGKADPRNPLASPVFGDYRGIPPLLIQAGEHEMLRDDSVRVAKKARADGALVKLEVWPGMFHVFQSHEPLLPEGREAIDHIAAFMRSSLPPLDIGSRLELLADDHLIDRLTGKAELRLRHPVPREIALITDRPWEGNAVNYVTVFRDGDIYRMYYRGANEAYTKVGARSTHREVYCYAESKDGVKWTRPNLGLFELGGSKKNNIVWDGVGSHNFTPFKDTNPAARPDALYKALGYGAGKAGRGLYAFKSADAIHWSLLSDRPIITRGAFDSQNLAFWDSIRKEYREYHRDFRKGRDIRTATSKDFLTWTEPVFLDYTPGRISELYTNQIIPYYRAPHLFLGFPTRYVDRGWTESARVLPRPDYRKLRGARSSREGTALTDGMLMTSRDGKRFRVWPESFLRPGLRARDNWFYGDNYQNWGLVETRPALEDGPKELSVYVTERTMQDRPGVLRRHTLRIDGFVSASAPLSGGELLTKPIRHGGNKLTLNCSTSTVGSIRVEIQDATGKPIRGFTLADCAEIYGDSLERTVTWKDDVGRLAGKSIRLRVELKDADLYSFQFRK